MKLIDLQNNLIKMKSIWDKILKDNFKDCELILEYVRKIKHIENSKFISTKDCNTKQLCEHISQDIRNENKYLELLVIYTNLKGADTFAIKDMIQELEEDSMCRFGILMCKE